MKPHVFRSKNGFCMYAERDTICNLKMQDPIHEPAPERVLSLGPGSVVPAPEREQFWPGSALSVWQGHADAVLALLKKKQAYGNAWQEQGYMGNIARILSKASRLKNMRWGDRDHEQETAFEESVVDTLYDLSALCSMAIANIEEGNRWGK